MAQGKDKSERRIRGKGKLFVISAPSGTGKTTLCQKLLKANPALKMSVSYTTRKPRKGEINDVHYSFISLKRFKAMIDKGEFAEWATVHGNLYGTSLKRLKKLNQEGYDIILDIDTHGALQIKKNYENAVYIFILPPSMQILKKRLVGRGTDAKEIVDRRLENAKAEIKQYLNYDYVVINNKVVSAYRELESIIVAHKLETSNVDNKWIKRLLE